MKYGDKHAQRKGTYGAASPYGKTCCAHQRKAVEVDYRNAKRTIDQVRMTDRKTITYNG